MADFLKENWNRITLNLPNIKTVFYQELTELYSSENRHYHNLDHIKVLLRLSEEYRFLLNSPQTIDFSIWYHDSIYDASKNNNEEKSAELARKHLAQLELGSIVVERCSDLIIATKNHQLSKNLDSFDAQFLMDVDLSILAVERSKYIAYIRQIRKEYKIYPDFLYKKGRKKVLEHFLQMENIYKTELFRSLWEEKAKENLSYELSLL